MKTSFANRIIGLKDATPEEIQQLKTEYPMGYHATEFSDGTPMPNNGVFFTKKPQRYNKMKRN